MKKHLKTMIVSALIGMSASSAFACSLRDVTTDHLRDLVSQMGGYPISDQQCALLNSHHLFLHVQGDSSVLDGVNLAWAVVTLENDDNVISSKSGIATRVNARTTASQDNANKLFLSALDGAISSLDWKGAVAQFDASGKAIAR